MDNLLSEFVLTVKSKDGNDYMSPHLYGRGKDSASYPAVLMKTLFLISLHFHLQIRDAIYKFNFKNINYICLSF